MTSIKIAGISLFLFVMLSSSSGNQVAESQQKWVPKYENQKNAPVPNEMLINRASEPDLSHGFTRLFNETNLVGWTRRGGDCTFEVRGDTIVGTCVKGSPSTYFSTVKEDYTNFIFTVELKWEVDGNSGIMFRAQRKKSGEKETVFGPQVEMEGFAKQRYWSGGIYGQACGGWYYPLWLEAHTAAREALKKGEWNRVTIKAQGKTIKTWLNGVPAAHWETEEYLKGFFGLQIHAGKEGTVLFRNIKLKEL